MMITDLEEFCIMVCDDQGDCLNTTIFVSVLPVCQGDSDFISTRDTILQSLDCESEVSYCLDLPFSQLDSFIFFDNGVQLERTIGCDYDSSFLYSYFTIPGQGSNGPYRVDNWTVNDEAFSGEFNTLSDLVDSLNIWDIQGNWNVDPTSLIIQGGHAQNNYGQLIVSQSNTGVQAFLGINSKFVPFAIGLELGIGDHQIIVMHTNTACTDTVEVMIQCADVVTSPDTISLFMEIGKDTIICIDQTELSSEAISIANYCEDISTEVVSLSLIHI